MDNELSDELKSSLKSIIQHFDKEDELVRQRQLAAAKKLKFYWNSFQRVWWSETAHDWRIYDQQFQSTDSNYYDKSINVFRAYIESIIAALSVTVPPIKCTPDDADNPSDIVTAKSGDKIANIIYKHNDSPLLWIRGLFVYCTEQLLAAYNYTDKKSEYGTYKVPKYKDEEITESVPTCPLCGGNEFDNEFQPDDESVELGLMLCEQCQQQVQPEQIPNTRVVTKIVGEIDEPKARQCIEVYGTLNVKVASYAHHIKQSPYLRFSDEVHFSVAIDEFPQLYDEESDSFRIDPGATTGIDAFERWARLPPQYASEDTKNLVTINKWWLRPCAFNVENDKTKRDALKKRFPNGAKICYVNDEYVESENSSLDDHWTIARNPLSDHVHYDPIGQLLTAIQEITNDLVSLILQTIEHGIPQTFADPQALDFELYKKTEVAPGTIFPAKARGGKGLGDYFYEVRTASLSQEVQPFGQKIQEFGQFVSGALPAIFGAMESKTATQDTMSRSQALQRLQNTWKMLNFWWKDIFGKVIPQYIKDVKEDERHSMRDPQNKNNYINVVIHKSELEGKLGDIELEAVDQLPLTWAQQKDIMMNLLQVANPEVVAALTSAENAPLVASAIGLNDFYIPGEDDRLKQYEEIAELLQSQPMPNPMTGEMDSSIQPDPLIDNHQNEAEICRKWLISEVGRQTKIDNLEGYMNVMLHMKGHIMILQGMNAGQPQNEPEKKKPAMSTSGTQSQQNAEVKQNGSTTIQ